MGSLFGSDEQKSKSNSTTSAAPTYTKGYENLYAQAQTAAAKPYDPNTNKTIAGFTAPQQQAFGQVQSNLGNYQPYMDQAAQLTGQGGQAISGADISNYMNPYQQQVIDATQNQFNTQNARSNQELAGNLARRSPVMGSGRDVAAALQSEAQMNAQNPVIASMYQQGYQNAQSTAQADKARMLNAGAQYGNLGGMQQNYANTDVGALLGVGNQQQGQQQNVNDAASANAAAQAGYDMDRLSWLAKMTSGGAGLSQTTTGTQTQSGGGSGLGQMIGTGLSLFSMLKDGGRVNGYAEGGGVGYQPGSYVPDLEIGGGIKAGGQAPSIGSQTQGGVSQGMGEVLNSFKAAQGAVGGMQNAFQKANTTTDSNGWATSSQPQSASGWGNWLGNGGFGSMFGFAEGGRVEEDPSDVALGSVFSDLDALNGPIMNAGVRPLVAPTETGSIQAVPQGPAPAPQKSGFLGLNFSDPMRQGLLSAGLGMMASKSGVPAMAIGQGGLQGIQAYQNATEQEAQQAQRKSMLEQQAAELRQRQLDAQQRFAQTSERMNMDREQHDWAKKYQQAQIERMQQAGARGRTPMQMSIQEREEAAIAQGMKKGTPEFQTFVLGGRMSNPPRQMPSIYDREQTKADIKRVEGLKEDAEAAEGMVGSLNSLKAARGATDTEGPWMGRAASAWGTDAAQRINSDAEAVRLSLVAKTKGAVSDAEMRIFGLATPGMMMSDEAANPVIQGMELAAQRIQEKAKFFDIWNRSNGNLAGAPEAWSKFVREKPVILEDPKTKAYSFQPANVDAWQPYIQKAKEPGAGLLPDAPEAQQQEAGGDYQEGAILENANGERIMLQGNEWVPAP